MIVPVPKSGCNIIIPNISKVSPKIGNTPFFIFLTELSLLAKYLDTNKCYQGILKIKEVSKISYEILNLIYGKKHDTQSENDADPTVDVTKVIRYPTVASWVQAMAADDSDLMSFYTWKDGQFHKLSRAERANFEGQLIFIPHYDIKEANEITGNWENCEHNITTSSVRQARAAYYSLIESNLQPGTEELIINAS